MNNQIIYKLYNTKDINDGLKKEFIDLFNKVFKSNMNLDWFNWKYIDNIYGDSFIVLAFDQDKLIGIRSFWRNDIKVLSYQPCDTLVDADYRGQGIFSKMSKLALEKLASYPIYNFPNENSYPGSLKLGWKVKNYYYVKKALSRTELEQGIDVIDDDYLKWKFIGHPWNKYYYTKKGEYYYLLVKRKANIYYVLGRFNGELSFHFEKAKFPILFYYVKNQTLMYKLFKNRANVLVYDNENILDHVPIYKADFF